MKKLTLTLILLMALMLCSCGTNTETVSVTLNPTSASVTEGEEAVFNAGADHAEKIVWIAVSPDTKTTYELDKVPDAFEGLKIQGQGTGKLTLSNIPYSMDGWQIKCYFTGNGGPVYTQGAYITVDKANVQVEANGFEGLISQYQEAIKGNYTPAQMAEKSLNTLIPECLSQDELASVGYSVVDLDGNGLKELVIAANSQSEFYTGMIFAVYLQDEEGNHTVMVESTDRNRWYYAGEGKLLNISSESSQVSKWYLCEANRDLGYLEAVEYDASVNPEDPWIMFNGSGWEHIQQAQADQKVNEFRNQVSNMEITKF